MSELKFSEDAWSDYTAWLLEDKKTVKRINDLLKETLRHPFEGQGTPEHLKGNNGLNWSRRINQKDRLVYQYSAEDDTVYVVSCKGHYNDK